MALASGWMGTLQARQDMPAPLSSLTSALYLRTERVTPAHDPAVELRFFLKPGAGFRGDRVVAVTQQSLELLSDWYGPFPYSTLTIVDAPWQSPLAGAAYPGALATSTRWISIERDGSADRALIAAIAAEYWQPKSTSTAFEQGVARYSAARAIDTILQGRQHWSRRYLGGFLPIAVRSLPLSPPRSPSRGRRVSYPELHGSAEAMRVMVAMQTLERFIGWPALQQGLIAYRGKFPSGGGTPEALLEILNEQGGRNLSDAFADAFRAGVRYDYGVELADSAADGARHSVHVALRRYGAAPFPVSYALHFADQTELRDRWNGRDDRLDLQYDSQSPLASVTVDPDNVLLLDEDPSNNVRSLAPGRIPAALLRGAASWLVWLQDLMLTGSAVS